jgi:UDP:flavonoid glycosyltransferase YjiC (YdhE family)
MEHVELIMSRGSNSGTRLGRDDSTEAASLDAFFAATRIGMIETLRYQALARSVDLLWQPEQVARSTMSIVDDVRPDDIVVDHLAFAATIGLRAMGRSYADVVLGHPTALPIADEIYGVPSAWPAAISTNTIKLDHLRELAKGVSRAFTDEYDRTLHAIAPGLPSVGDAFSAHGDVVLYNYPAELHDPSRSQKLPVHAFLGSATRTEAAPPDVAAWLSDGDTRPLVVVSFGTFLAARTDVLARVAAALKLVDARVAIATGDAEHMELGALPDEWLVRPSLPQVALLQEADLLITHGGNNSVTEALTFGVPMIVMPFSTDQFDGAAAVERWSAGVALDPNRSSRPLIAGTVRGLLRKRPSAPRLIGDRLRARRGPELAYEAVRATSLRPASAGHDTRQSGGAVLSY